VCVCMCVCVCVCTCACVCVNEMRTCQLQVLKVHHHGNGLTYLFQSDLPLLLLSKLVPNISMYLAISEILKAA